MYYSSSCDDVTRIVNTRLINLLRGMREKFYSEILREDKLWWNSSMLSPSSFCIALLSVDGAVLLIL